MSGIENIDQCVAAVANASAQFVEIGEVLEEVKTFLEETVAELASRSMENPRIGAAIEETAERLGELDGGRQSLQDLAAAIQDIKTAP